MFVGLLSAPRGARRSLDPFPGLQDPILFCRKKLFDSYRFSFKNPFYVPLRRVAAVQPRISFCISNKLPPEERSSGFGIEKGRPRKSAPTPQRPPRPPVTNPDDNVPLGPVVKVYTVSSRPNYKLPWQDLDPEEFSGSGAVIHANGKPRVLTNAHVIDGHTFVRVRKQGCPKFYIARVLAVASDCDCALLSVAESDEDEFFRDMEPFVLSDRNAPDLQEEVMVLGYPTGGDSICCTEGIVSRVELLQYDSPHHYWSGEFRGLHLLCVQIDAAVNNGNSGGPVLGDHGEIVGIVFAGLDSGEAESVGYVIPSEVLRHFVDDLRRNDGHYVGFPWVPFSYQTCDNPSVREWSGLSADVTGVRVTDVDALSDAFGRLQYGDVVSEINGIHVANDGTVLFRGRERVGFEYLISRLFVGDKYVLGVNRAGKKFIVELQARTKNYLAPPPVAASRVSSSQGDIVKGWPSFFTFAGLVFVALEDYLQSFTHEEDRYIPSKMIVKFCQGKKSFPDEQVVVLMKILADEVNVGYELQTDSQVISVNDVAVRNLRHLAVLVETCSDRFLRFQMDNGSTVVIDMLKGRNASQQILERYRVRAPMSDDILEVVRSASVPLNTQPVEDVLAVPSNTI